MLIKIHQGYRKTIALSDTNLLDKTFTQDIKEIDRLSLSVIATAEPDQRTEMTRLLNSAMRFYASSHS